MQLCGVGFHARSDSSVLGLCLMPASAEGRAVVVFFPPHSFLSLDTECLN